MSKARALKTGMAATVVVTTAACAALMAMHAGGELVAVAMVVLGGSGAHVLSRIVMHYD